MQTLEQVRDEIAGLMGQGWIEREGCYDSIDGCHPVPSTLDGIAALWPDKWRFSLLYQGRKDFQYIVSGSHWNEERRVMAPTELEARTRLLLAVLKAEKSNAH